MTQPRWLALAWGDLGVAETPGPNHAARVVGYYVDVGHPHVKDDETAWCAAFLGSCLERSGVRSTRSLMARSYLNWGEPLNEPRYGAIAVLSRTADPALGHVGFLVDETTDSVILLGGNQGNRVCVEAFPRTRLLALRWPGPLEFERGGGRSVPSPIMPKACLRHDLGEGQGGGESQTSEAGAPPTPNPSPSCRRHASGMGGGEPAGDALFDRALAHVLAMEGGYTEDPHDPGGPTNFGITLATYARDKGLVLTAENLGQLKAELKAIPQADVRRIYRERYWLAASCPDLPAPLALFHFDAAVNHGLQGAAHMLQEAVGADVDGEIGPETLAQATSLPVAQSLARYAGVRRRQYRSLSAFARFGKGWLARVDRTLAAAVAALPAPARSPSPQEKHPMANATDVPAEAPATKWWAHSLTIWGAVITTLSTVLPAIGPLIGLDITPEVVRQLGEQAILAVQAVGGLTGTILTVYGRVRATATLERRQLKLTM